MTAGVYLNGRRPEDWELAAIADGRRCEREREQAVLAGLLGGEPAERVARPVTDLEFSGPGRRL